MNYCRLSTHLQVVEHQAVRLGSLPSSPAPRPSSIPALQPLLETLQPLFIRSVVGDPLSLFVLWLLCLSWDEVIDRSWLAATIAEWLSPSDQNITLTAHLSGGKMNLYILNFHYANQIVPNCDCTCCKLSSYGCRRGSSEEELRRQMATNPNNNQIF